MPTFFNLHPTLKKCCLTTVIFTEIRLVLFLNMKGREVKFASSKKTTFKKPNLIRVKFAIATLQKKGHLLSYLLMTPIYKEVQKINAQKMLMRLSSY